MAKPKHGHSNLHNDCTVLETPQRSSSSSRHRRQRRPYLRPPQRRRRPSRSSSSSVPCPSPAVLSALAVIAAAPPIVAGSPLPVQTTPPSFLCPFIECDNSVSVSVTPSTIPPHIAARSAVAPTPAPQPSKRSQVADKFVQGSDKRWRKTDAWTLYGSTCCASTSSINNAPSQPTSSTQTLMPNVTASPVTLDASVLPAGWTSSSSSSSNSAVILSLAIVLAVAICGFMIGCISWRKKRGNPGKEKDIEFKARYKTRHDDTSEDEREREVRGKMRIWARATARWKANIRHSARRRRKRNLMTSRISRPSSPVPDAQEMPISTASIHLSRRSLDAHRSTTPMSDTNDTPTPAEQMPASQVLSCVQTFSPPDYQSLSGQRHSVSPMAYDHNPSTSRPASLLFDRDNNLSPSDELMPYAGPPDGHIAMGDKADLERIREMASAPPDTDADASEGTLQLVSAPELDDVPDELDGFDFQRVTSPPPSFPPLPSKADVPSGCFEGSPFSYNGDPPAPGSDVGPSAPPFEASSSATPVNGLGLEPSAPSWDDDDDSQDWEREVSLRENLESSSVVIPRPSVSSPSPSPPVSSASVATLSNGRVSLAREGTLPSYRP